MRGTFILTLFIFISVYTFAAWLNFEPQTVQQPDGTTLHIYATGDEFHNWLHDDEGFTIIQDPVDGFYYYAILDQGRLIPSEYKVNTIDPSAAGLSPWINISPEEMQAKRDYFYKHQMPDKPAMEGYKSPENTKNEGTLNNLVVYIRFSDQSEFTEDTTFYYNMFNGEGNTMLNYFNTVSYDMISIPSWFYPVPEGTTVISYQDIYPRSYFMPYHPVTNPNGYQSGENGPMSMLC